MNKLAVVIFVLLPGAFFGALIAGSVCYSRDHAQMQRTHRANPEYLAVLGKYEDIGAILGAIPGGLVVLLSKRTKRVKSQ